MDEINSQFETFLRNKTLTHKREMDAGIIPKPRENDAPCQYNSTNHKKMDNYGLSNDMFADKLESSYLGEGVEQSEDMETTRVCGDAAIKHTHHANPLVSTYEPVADLFANPNALHGE